MSVRKPLIILSLIILVVISITVEANTRWNLLEGIDPNPADFKELEIGKKIVYWHQRKIDEAIVGGDQIIYHFDRNTHELLNVIVHWREDLPPFLPELKITREQAESMVEGRVEFSSLYFITPESYVFSPIQPTPKNPCWVVNSVDQAKGTLITVIDAVEGKILGYGVPPPSYTAFSLAGPQEQNPCRDTPYPWDPYYKTDANSAKHWFVTMGYSTEDVNWPTEEKVKSHIQSDTTAMFYEIAHSRYTCGKAFASGCVDGQCYELTTSDEIDDWISDYSKLPFAFIASCTGMCCTDVGTLSHAFRMGSTRDTATVGYCCMGCEKCKDCWYNYALDWQRALFEDMNDGSTVKEAFDIADACYPACANSLCMRFAGDLNFAVVPIVPRVPPFPSLTIVDDVNDDDCVYPLISEAEHEWIGTPYNWLYYNIHYDADGNEANDVIIVDQLPVEVDYYSSDSNGDYDSNSRTVTWEIGHISGTDSNCVHLTVKVNKFAKPGSAFRNYCEIRNDEYSRNATEKTNVCCWGPGIIYVDANAGGFNNGTCWEDAYTDLQDGLTGASNCDGKDVIMVAGGTYKPTEHVWQEIATFQLVNGVDIYGGYPSGGGQRNPDTYETILTGDIDGNTTPDIDYVVTGADNAILDEFTITRGRRGVYCKDCNNLTVADCIISENQTGVDGGGIYDSNSSSLTITNCTFSGNSAGDDGGGIYNDHSSPNISNCIFTDNTGDFGGGIGNFNQSSPTISNCIFTGNSANGFGAGGIGNAYQSSSTVRNCIFTGNTAAATTSNSTGGGISNYYSSPTITNCVFSGNAATSPYYSYGGGMRNYQSSPTVTNCSFSGNSAGWGGGMQNHNESSPTVTNCSFSGNLTYYGGAMHNEDNSDPNVTNCIFWGNDADYDGNQIYNYGDDSDPNFSYCDIEDSNGSGDDWHLKLGIDGGGNIDEDPLFYDPNDPNDYHLGPNSPCIDKGDPNFDPDPNETDIDGEPRIVNGRVDIGADEFDDRDADFSNDGTVNFIDYAMFADVWQTNNPDFSLDDDNDVDMNDLVLFVEDWLWQAGWTKTFAAGCAQSMSQSLALTEGLYPSATAEQPQPRIEPVDAEDILKWLEGLWLTDEQVREMISEDDWQKFVESVTENM